MENIDCSGKLHGVDSAKSVSVEIRHDLKHARSTEAGQWLRRGVLVANLSIEKGLTDFPHHLARKGFQVVKRRSHPFDPSSGGRHSARHMDALYEFTYRHVRGG